MLLTRNEKMLIADALNGYGMLEHQPDYLAMMTGAPSGADELTLAKRRLLEAAGYSCALEHEIYDAIRLDGLDQKWEIDKLSILGKLHDMSPPDRERLVRRIAEVWDRNDENFERDLESLEV